MRHSLHMAVAVATILSSVMLASRAESAPAAPLGAVAVPAAPVLRVTVVCGGGGCAPVQTKQIKHRGKLPQHI